MQARKPAVTAEEKEELNRRLDESLAPPAFVAESIAVEEEEQRERERKAEDDAMIAARSSVIDSEESEEERDLAEFEEEDE